MSTSVAVRVSQRCNAWLIKLPGVDVAAGEKKPFWDAVQPAMGSVVRTRLLTAAALQASPLLQVWMDIAAMKGPSWSIPIYMRSSQPGLSTLVCVLRQPVELCMHLQAPWKPFVSAVERGVRFSVTGTLKSAPASEADKLWQLQFR